MLNKISSFLARWTPGVVIAAAILAFFAPEIFSWVRGTSQTVVLGVIMLAMGMTLKEEDFRILASRPLDMAIGALAQFLLMPSIAWMLVKCLGLPDGLATGLILVGCCPGGVSSNIMSFLCGGDVAFSVGMTTVSTLLAPLATPALMLFVAGESIDIDAVAMFKSILIVTLLPVASGFALNKFFGKTPQFAHAVQLMPGVAVIALACIVGGVVSAHGERFAQSGLVIFAAVFAHNALGYLTGYLAGAAARFNAAKRKTIAIEVGMQNAGLATVLATRHFPLAPEAAIASAVSCVWHSISGALLAGLFNTIDNFLRRRKSSSK